MAAAARWASPAVVLLVAAAVLALHPALWLVASWRDPAYNPQGALAANTLRIVALALAYAPGLDLVDGFAHEALGVLALMLAAAPVLLWAARIAPRSPCRSAPPLPDALPRGERGLGRARATAWLLLGFAIVAVSAPAQPLDVAREVDPPRLPGQLGGHPAQPRALGAVERAYFARYGGGASKSAYGPFGLLLVSTRAPLRHLHAPDECLRGAGHRVRYLGLAHDGLPSALYRATDADGRSWRVAVSYISDRGERAASVAEAVWRWRRTPGSTWTQVQRVAPWNVDAAERAYWETVLRRALDLPTPSESIVYRVADAR
jgi:hypothetical protein